MLGDYLAVGTGDLTISRLKKRQKRLRAYMRDSRGRDEDPLIVVENM